MGKGLKKIGAKVVCPICPYGRAYRNLALHIRLYHPNQDNLPNARNAAINQEEVIKR